jgi:hypothetical protein
MEDIAQGHLLFIEHVRFTDPGLARFQDRMNGINRFVSAVTPTGTLDSISEAGFTITQVELHQVAEGPEVRAPSHRGQRRGSAKCAFPGRAARHRRAAVTRACRPNVFRMILRDAAQTPGARNRS